MKKYSLRKSRKILREGFHVLKKRTHLLSASAQDNLKTDLQELETSIFQKDKLKSSEQAKHVESFLKEKTPKKFLHQLLEVASALLFALVIAFAIRQFWFELYEVPTGSMRPTVKELDRLFVSKTTFGIKVPFIDKLQLFSPNAIKRAGIVVFTVEGMDVADADTLYFHLFPGKKRFIKRGMARPGDTVYFYGGRIYGVSSKGDPIEEISDEGYLKSIGIEKIDHIPYITLEGKVKLGSPIARDLYGSAVFKQMNLPIARLETDQRGGIKGAFFNGKEWAADRPNELRHPRSAPQSYSDLWGIGNYAMARLLLPSEAEEFYPRHPALKKDALLFLELRHTPNLTYPAPEIRRDETGKFRPSLTPYATLIPLNREHLDTLQKNLYTARFIIDEGRAYRYQEGRRPQRPEFDPLFPGVPDGSYEFYYGKGYAVHFGGIRTELPGDHPLYNPSKDNIRKLFNMGIGFNIVFEPMAPNQPYNPQRFAYFRNGGLYVMGAPLLKKDDPVLVDFVSGEKEKQRTSTSESPYIAFIDHGPPLTEGGRLDIEFIKNFGLMIPEGGLLALGDNFAMSGDSRDFGFVPLENLRGAPSFIFWPPGRRVGALPQPSYPWITWPNLIIWGSVAVILVLTAAYLYRRNRTSLF